MKTLFIIFLITFPFSVLSNWNTESSSVLGQYGLQTISSDQSKLSLQYINMQVESNHLNEGWGISGKHQSKWSHSDDVGIKSNYSQIWNLDSRIFISDAINFDFDLSSANQLMFDGLFRTRNETSTEAVYKEKSQSLLGALNVAKDNTFWNLDLVLNAGQNESHFIGGATFIRTENLAFGALFDWQISEDSYFTSKVELSENRQLLYQIETDVVSSYLGLKTQYFGASKLEVYLGSSVSSQTNDIFSWQLTHTTTINDYSNITLVSKRTLTETDDVRFNVSETTENRLTGRFSYGEDWRYSIDVTKVIQRLSEAVSVDRLMISNSLLANLSQHWQAVISHSFEDHNDDRVAFKQQAFQLVISREFV